MHSLGTKRNDENIVYSVRLRRGPDRIHYDLIFGEASLELRYLGEYWEKSRPSTGMQRRQDLLIYSIMKRKRRRSSPSSRFDIVIPYTSIKSAVVKRKADDRGVLILTLTDGSVIEIEFSIKVYDLVKRLTKQKLGDKMMRAR